MVKNPSAVAFASPDHAHPEVTGYEIDIVHAETAEVIQTIVLDKATGTMAGADVLFAVNVQPVAFGRYVLVARAVAGAVQSENSAPSEEWERSPGAPSKPTVQ